MAEIREYMSVFESVYYTTIRDLKASPLGSLINQSSFVQQNSCMVIIHHLLLQKAVQETLD
jgi:hypothetical protein